MAYTLLATWYPPRRPTGPSPMSIRLFERWLWYDLAREVVNLGMFRQPIARALDARANQRVLDVGCGTGVYAGLVPGDYIGLDPDAGKIAYARRYRDGARRTWLVGTLEDHEATLQGKRFDTALVVNVLHHLSDGSCEDLLARLARLVTRRLVVVDHPSDTVNRWRGLLLRLDPGHNLRSQQELERVVTSSFDLVRTGSIISRSRSVSLTLLVCEPRSG